MIYSQKYAFAIAIATIAVSLSHAQAIVGGWVSPDGLTAVTFLSDGHYFVASDGIADSGGNPGMERGTYHFGSGSLSTLVTQETNGDWGFGTNSISASLISNTLTFPLGGAFSRVTSFSNPIVGSWVSSDELTVLTFLADGRYFDIESGAADAFGGPGIERGTFSLTSGNLSLTDTLDTNGGWGFGVNTLPTTLVGDNLTIDGFELTRVGVAASAVPEPSSYAAWGGIFALTLAVAKWQNRRSINASAKR